MNVFVTGATGFIGSHFIPTALSNGFHVTALRSSEKSVPRISWTNDPNFVTKPLDSLEKSDFNGVDIVVHFAAHSVNVPYDSLEQCMYWNAIAPLKAFFKARDAGVERFIIAGSCFEYGMSGERYEFIPPNAPLEPTATYSASKAAASIAFNSFAAETNAIVSIHRIFQVYGEGEPASRLWPTLKAAAALGSNVPMTEGMQVRDFIHVEDVAKHFLSAIDDSRAKPGRAFIENVGSGRACTIREFAEFWWKEWNATGKLIFGALPYRKNESMRYVPLLTQHQALGS
jgi:nucleoside-diphosphate-sugar epimerase